MIPKESTHGRIWQVIITLGWKERRRGGESGGGSGGVEVELKIMFWRACACRSGNRKSEWNSKTREAKQKQTCPGICVFFVCICYQLAAWYHLHLNACIQHLSFRQKYGLRVECWKASCPLIMCWHHQCRLQPCRDRIRFSASSMQLRCFEELSRACSFKGCINLF